ILRYATVYGAGEEAGRVVSTFIYAALAAQPPVIDGDGLDEHDLVHVTDAVDATLSALRHRADGVYNVGSGRGVTTLALAHLVGELAGTRADPVCRTWKGPERGAARMVCDTSLASADIGFAARRPLVDGIREEIGWVRAQRAGTPDPGLAASA